MILLATVTACASGADPATTSTIPTATTTVPGVVGTTPTAPAPSTTTTTTATIATTTTTMAELTGLAIEPVATGLAQPLHLLAAPGSGRLFVVERTGRVWEITSDGSTGMEPFLDLTDRVNSSGIEQGLLGLAFHPDFARNGRLFAFYYHGPDTTRLVELSAEPGTATVDPATENVLLTLDKPTVRHNGGMVEFGPDGMLYVSIGEGGAASINSQNPSTLLSSILRLDVDRGHPYAIPPDNPFVGGGGAPEVWAYGLRNPWRFAIDGDDIYIADVGQERIEEIDVVTLDDGGSNFGWLRMEGSSCFQRGCDPAAESLVLPVLEYTHDDGCSVIGGRVYRGSAIPEVDGVYFYSDWCGGWLRSFRWTGTTASEQTEWLTGIGQVNGFGEDAAGELYVLTYGGDVGRIVPVRAR